MPLNPATEDPAADSRLLRDLRALWLVPCLLLCVVAALLFFVDQSPRPLLNHPFWQWCVFAVLASLGVYWPVYGRAEALAEILRARAAAQTALAVTNAQLYERSRRQGEDLRRVIQRISEAVGASDDITRIADIVAAQAQSLLGADGACLFLLSEDHRTLNPTVCHLRAGGTGGTPAVYEMPLRVSESPRLQGVLSSPAPVVLERGALGSPDSLLAATLRGPQQSAIGMLLLHWTNAAYQPAEEELELAAALAGFAAVAVENARLAAASQQIQQLLTDKNARLREEGQRRGDELQSLMRRIGEALAAGFSRARVAELVVEQACRMIPCDKVMFSMRDERGDFVSLAASGSGQMTPEWQLANFSFLRDLLIRSAPLLIANVADDGRLTARERAALRGKDIAAMLIAPLRGRGDQVIGLLSLFWTAAAHTPAPDDFKILDVLAAQAAAALENARLYEQLEQAEAELKMQLIEANSARDFVQRILQNVQAPVFVLSADFEQTIHTANALAEAMPDPEQQRDGLTGRCFGEVFPGLETLLGDAVARAVTGESITLADVEYDGLARGATHWTFSLTPQRDPANRRVAQIVLLALETTDRIRLLRERERNARAERQRANELDATLRSLGDGVVLCDPAGCIVSVNRAARVILGMDFVTLGERVEVWARNIGLCYPSGSPVPPGAVPLSRTLRSGRAGERAEYLIRAAIGDRVIELTTTPVSATDDLPDGVSADAIGGAVAVLRDVTALKESQRLEAAANKRIETLVEISRRLNATLNLDEIHVIVTQGALALLPGIPDTRALLYAFEGEGKPLVLLGDTPRAIPFDSSSPVIWQVYVVRQPVVSSDIVRDPRFASEADRALFLGGEPECSPALSALMLPLPAREAVSGHLALTSSAPGAFDDPRLVDALTNLAALAAIARVNARLYEQMKQKADELDALWTVGHAISSKLQLNDVVTTLTDRVRIVMGVETCRLALFEPDAEGGRSLRLQGTPDSDVSADMLACRAGQEAAATGEPVMLARQADEHSVLAVPLRYGEETLGALMVAAPREHAFIPEQVKLLRALASLAVAAVRNARIFAHEQNIAETLQKSFLPEERTQMPGLEIAQRYYPSLLSEARIGGDYYDFIPLGPRRLAVVIGDISGKGLAAAVYTAMAKYTLRAFAAQGMPPVEVVTRANVAMARDTRGEIFSTLFYGVFDLESGALTYVNAGHEPPQLLRESLGGDWLSLDPTGPILGAFADAEYEQSCLSLQPGDTLALYTDGLSDARAADGEFFGLPGIRAHLAAARAQNSEGIATALHAAALDFTADHRMRDDIALLVLKLAKET